MRRVRLKDDTSFEPCRSQLRECLGAIFFLYRTSIGKYLKPEMAMMCVVLVALKASRRSGLIPFWKFG